MSMQRSISTLALWLASLGCMVGSGWLFGAYYAAQIAGPGAIISWILGGGMVLLVALAFAELSTMMPVTGGIARYSHFSHGAVVSFGMSWLAWLSCVAVAPTEVQACLQYAASYYPFLVNKVNHAHVLTQTGWMIAIVLLWFISLINVMGMKLLMRINALLTWFKILIPLIVVATIMSHRFDGQLLRDIDLSAAGWHHIVWALPTAGIIFSFLGFREITSLAGETKHPQRSLPIALIGSVLFCTLLYVFIQVGFLGALTPEALLQGWGKLSFAGDAGPFAGLAVNLGLGTLVYLIYADALISPLGTANMYTATTSRLNYAMAYNRYAPQYMLQLNQRSFPARAVWVNFLIGIWLFIPLPSWQALVSFQSIAIVLAYGVGPIALLCLRKQLPDQERPFRLPYAKVLCLLIFYGCNLMAYWTGWDTIWRLMVALSLGFVLLIVYRSSQPEKQTLDWQHASWLFVYFAGLTLISYLGNFGGGLGLLSFGWDFFVLAIWSMCVLCLACHLKRPAQTVQAYLNADHEMQLFYDE